MSENIFSVINPEDYSCGVLKYLNSHSVLHIYVVNNARPPDSFFLAFYPVEYFSGPLVWQSVNFQLAPVEECLKLLQKLERFKTDNLELLIGADYKLKLFYVETPKNTIQIIAREGKLHNEVWALG